MRQASLYELICQPEKINIELKEVKECLNDKLRECDLAVKAFRESLGAPQLEADLSAIRKHLSVLEIIKELQRCAEEDSPIWWQLCYQSPGFLSFLGQDLNFEIEQPKNEKDIAVIRKMKAEIVLWKSDLDLERDIKQITCPKCQQTHPLIFKCWRKHESFYDEPGEWDIKIIILCPITGPFPFAVIFQKWGEFGSDYVHFMTYKEYCQHLDELNAVKIKTINNNLEA